MSSEENGFICLKQHELLKRITPIGFTGTVKILRLWYVLNAKTKYFQNINKSVFFWAIF